jgi:hypothetical protein
LRNKLREVSCISSCPYNSNANSIQELQNASADTNPVARWVEAVQPWMPAAGGDVEDGQDMPDWTSRAKGEASFPFYIPILQY